MAVEDGKRSVSRQEGEGQGEGEGEGEEEGWEEGRVSYSSSPTSTFVSCTCNSSRGVMYLVCYYHTRYSDSYYCCTPKNRVQFNRPARLDSTRLDSEVTAGENVDDLNVEQLQIFTYSWQEAKARLRAFQREDPSPPSISEGTVQYLRGRGMAPTIIPVCMIS